MNAKKKPDVTLVTKPALKEAAPPPPARVKIDRQPERPYRKGCAREAWWIRFNKFEGKPLADLEESCQKDPPSLPTKGKSAGVAEQFSGWLNFFKTEMGLVSTPLKK